MKKGFKQYGLTERQLTFCSVAFLVEFGSFLSIYWSVCLFGFFPFSFLSFFLLNHKHCPKYLTKYGKIWSIKKVFCLCSSQDANCSIKTDSKSMILALVRANIFSESYVIGVNAGIYFRRLVNVNYSHGDKQTEFNVHKICKWCPGPEHHLNILCTFNLFRLSSGYFT